MAISKDKTRLMISIKKENLELIEMFSSYLKTTKSEFIESVVSQFINDFCKNQEAKRKEIKNDDKKRL